MKSLSRSITALSLISGCLATAVQADEFIFAHGANPGNPRHEAAEMFAAIVPSCSPGDLSVNVAPSSTMGDDAEMLISAMAGVIQMSANSQGTLAQVVPEVASLGLPFLFENEMKVWQVLDGPVKHRLDEIAQKSRLKIVTFWDNGFRHVTHVDKFVRTPSDIVGMKIRTPPDRMTLDIFKALKANPAPLSWSELPTALQSGTFDGQENPLTNIYSAKLHEISPFISMTGHQYQSTPVVAGLEWWNSLSEQNRDCIQLAAEQAGWYQRGRNYILNQNLVTKIKNEGGQFSEVDRAAFAEATLPVYEKYQNRFGEFVTDLRKAAKQ